MIFFTIPFFLQAILIGADEWFFHLRRNLPKWERIGHPIDTLSVLICFAFLYLIPFSPLALKWYIALALVSSILITKDEFVHKHHCPAAEQWLHAVLFINHPILLSAAAILWYHSPPLFPTFLFCQGSCVAAFMFYQIIYWNFVRDQ